jgi:hypothetical protein
MVFLDLKPNDLTNDNILMDKVSVTIGDAPTPPHVLCGVRRGADACAGDSGNTRSSE